MEQPRVFQIARVPERTERKHGAVESGQMPRREAIERAIPSTYAALVSAVRRPEETGIVVVFHDCDATRPYGVCTLQGEQLAVLGATGRVLHEILAPMQAAHGWYRKRRKLAPNVYIAFDLVNGHAWLGRSLKAVQHRQLGPHVDAETLERVSAPTTPTTGEPPRLALRAERFAPDRVPLLRSTVSDGADRPEEVFLLHEDLLRLAVDSLDGADVLDPLPVHLNALWVFARPIIMQRSDGSDRHVRAVWFRQGAVMWRIRTYTAGSTMRVKQVGAQLAGRIPFVAVWDDTRPEQKLLAAIWALMSQGGVTESDRRVHRDSVGAAPDASSAGQLTVVRVKAGTDHALVYGPDGANRASPRASWRVRGHWRHQPYPSLGHDEDGNVRTRPIWISSYVKGDSSKKPATEKVITVRP